MGRAEITSNHGQPGVLLIEPLELPMKCIKIKNTGDSEESLGGLTLKSTGEGLETIYKFHRTVKCPPGGVVAVWSSDAGEEHIPSEGQLVMKEGAWKFGDLVESFGSSRRFSGRRTGLEARAEGDKNCSIM